MEVFMLVITHESVMWEILGCLKNDLTSAGLEVISDNYSRIVDINVDSSGK